MPLKIVSKELLGQFGLSESEVNVYLVALSLGEFSVYDLASHLSLPYESVRDVVERLVERGFLRKLPAVVDRYVALTPFLELFIELYERTLGEINALKGEVSSYFEEASKRLRELSKQVASCISVELEGTSGDMASLMDSVAKRYAKFVEEGSDVLRGVAVSVEELLSSFLSTSMVKMVEVDRFEGNAVSLSEMTQEFLKRVDGSVRAVVDAQIKLIGALQNEVSRRLDQLAAHMEALLENHYKNHVRVVEELVQFLGKTIGEEMKQLRAFTEKCEVDASWLVEGVAVRVSSLLQSGSRKFVQTVASGIRRELEAFKVLHSKLNELVSRALVVAKELEFISNIKTSFFGSSGISRIKSALEAWSRELLKLATSVQESYNEILAIEADTLRTVEDEVVKNVTSTINEEQENLKNALQSIKRDIEDRLGVFPELFESKVTDEINSSLLRSTRSCEDTTNAVLSFMRDEFKNLTRSLVASLSSYAKEVIDLLSSYTKSVAEAVKLLEFSALILRRKLSQTIQERLHEYDMKGEALVKDLRREQSDKLVEVKRKISERVGAINQKAVRDLEAAAGSLEEAGKRTENAMEDVVSRMEDGVKTLEDVWNSSLEVAPVYSGTWTIVGKNSIAKHMAGMLGRAKKSVTLVLPQPHNEVLEAVKQVRSDVKVKIAVQVAVELPILRELALLDNVEIYWCREAAFWGLVIDDKEVLIAPVDAENPPVATVSVQEGAVRFYGKVIEDFVESLVKKKPQTISERQVDVV
ncbi:MAG: helix-turn-helix domain-containing protein [Candidatus Jordarchaeales archaeon]